MYSYYGTEYLGEWNTPAPLKVVLCGDAELVGTSGIKYINSRVWDSSWTSWDHPSSSSSWAAGSELTWSRCERPLRHRITAESVRLAHSSLAGEQREQPLSCVFHRSYPGRYTQFLHWNLGVSSLILSVSNWKYPFMAQFHLRSANANIWPGFSSVLRVTPWNRIQVQCNFLLWVSVIPEWQQKEFIHIFCKARGTRNDRSNKIWCYAPGNLSLQALFQYGWRRWRSHALDREIYPKGKLQWGADST